MERAKALPKAEISSGVSEEALTEAEAEQLLSLCAGFAAVCARLAAKSDPTAALMIAFARDEILASTGGGIPSSVARFRSQSGARKK